MTAKCDNPSCEACGGTGRVECNLCGGTGECSREMCKQCLCKGTVPCPTCKPDAEGGVVSMCLEENRNSAKRALDDMIRKMRENPPPPNPHNDLSGGISYLSGDLGDGDCTVPAHPDAPGDEGGGGERWVCPVCDEPDPDGGEACAKCYGSVWRKAFGRDACVGDEIRVYRDGDAWCAVRRDGFTNIQECNAGFHATPDGAVRALLKEETP